MKNYINFFFFSFILLFSCSKKIENKVNDDKNLFLTVFTKTDLKTPISINLWKDFENLQTNQNILRNINDTIKIKIKPYQFIEIHSKLTLTDSIIVKQGDTLILDFSKDGIIKTIRNKKISKAKTVNYKQIIDTAFISKINTLTSKYFKTDYSNPLLLHNDFSKIKVYPLIPNFENIKNISKVDEFIKKYDSLYQVYKKTSIAKHKGTKAHIYENLFKNKMFEDFLNIYKISKNENIKNYLLSSRFIGNKDSLFNEYGILRTLLFTVMYGNEKDKSRSQIVYNIPKIYDDIPNKFSDTTLIKKARIICLEEMISQGNSLEEVTNFYNMFNSEYNDSNFKNYFESSYLINLKERYNSPLELNLMDNYGQIKTLNNLVEELKGNVIYIDFWASWCAPCRKAMPASRELLNEFNGKENIIFFYLSTDKKSIAWKNASKIEKIEAYKHNYLILNQNKSNLMNDLKINEIPRYLIFDTKGKLVEENAPGPTSKNIKNLLLKYTSE